MDFKDKVTEISKKAGKVATDTYNTVADKSGKLFKRKSIIRKSILEDFLWWYINIIIVKI